ncbi:MAG: D-alanine--D-alanine ligase, partial [Bacteroidota bacterium]
ESHHSEQTVIVEGFIDGKEFSCIVLKNEDGSLVALPPTEIIKGSEVFDYRSKYLPGLSRKETPINIEEAKIIAIQKECERLFEFLDFQTYARIDGFITANDTIYLNDPNTTSGMLPSSFFFHQAAEVGLNPSQFLTYIIRTSLKERIDHSVEKNHYSSLLNALDEKIKSLKSPQQSKKKVGVILGGYSFERHISVESGRNIYEKLSSSLHYEAIPIFLSGNKEGHELYKLPINLLLKDNADDIKDGIANYKKHPLIEALKNTTKSITDKYTSSHTVFEPELISYEDLSKEVDAVFIALHGRPGEDGTVQQELRKFGIPYNGSDHDSASITINKYQTLQILKEHGFVVADQSLIQRTDYLIDANNLINSIEKRFSYPFVAKPVDDGCSSAVKIIRSKEHFKNYLSAIFRTEEELDKDLRNALGLKYKEEFPKKDELLIESLIHSNGAKQ